MNAKNIKPDEKHLLIKIREAGKAEKLPYVRAIVSFLGINEKRAEYIFEKWCRKDWYEYGVSPFAGWLTQKGKLAADQIAMEKQDG